MVWGVYDLATRSCGVPGTSEGGLATPPLDAEGFRFAGARPGAVAADNVSFCDADAAGVITDRLPPR